MFVQFVLVRYMQSVAVGVEVNEIENQLSKFCSFTHYEFYFCCILLVFYNSNSI